MQTAHNKIIKPKLGLLELAKQLGNVSKACKVMGYSRDTFYRFKQLYEQGGEEALRDIVVAGRPNKKNRVDPDLEHAVVEKAIANPALGQQRVSNELKKEGILISPGGVRSIWLRNDLETFSKRLKALEARSAQENLIYTEEQLQALERAKSKKEAHGEIETEHPGYLCSQDTYYVGCFKGVGRVYQQTFIDTYSRVAHAKLYTEKTAISAADTLNSTVVPFYDEQGIQIQRILTDRGTEYVGKVEHHAYELYLAVENIDHTKTKVRSPQTNGICERFHRTMKHEFYDISLRKKVYNNLDEIQADVTIWLRSYNEDRPHSGKYCYGKTPMETFLSSKYLAKSKQIPELEGAGFEVNQPGREPRRERIEGGGHLTTHLTSPAPL